MSEEPSERPTVIDTMATPGTSLMPIRILDWHREVKGSRIGTVTILLGAAMKLIDLPVNWSNGTFWVGLPARPLTSGRDVKIGDNGRPIWKNLVQWTDRRTADRFTLSVLTAIRQTHGEGALAPPT